MSLTFEHFDDNALPLKTGHRTEPTFWAAGLGGESGETVEALMACLGLSMSISTLQNTAKKIERDELGASRDGDLLKEAGDVLFYLRAILRVQGLTLEGAAEACLEKLGRMDRTPASRDLPLTDGDRTDNAV